MVNTAAEAKKKYVWPFFSSLLLYFYTNLLYLFCIHSEGNEAFKNQDYSTAVAKYTEAIELDPSNHVYFSNRRFTGY